MLLSIALGSGAVTFYLRDLAAVPFHPDESVYIYMSRDFDTLVLQRDPLALAWQPREPLFPEARKRLLDAPLTRYLDGLGRWLGGYTVADLPTDWAWGAPWEANRSAIPSPALLLAARAPSAILGALTAVVLFWIGVQMRGIAVGLIAAGLYALDPLTLLHTQRAMAEGALMFFSTLTICATIVLAERCNALSQFNARVLTLGAVVGLLAGLAMNSKQSAIVMLPLALAVSAGVLWRRPWLRARRLAAIAALCGVIVLGWAATLWLLNPILYREPLAIAQAMVAMRVELTREQVAVNGASQPELILASAPARLAATVTELYWQLPAGWDVPVYLEQLKPPMDVYLSNPLHVWLREPLASITLLLLSAIGVVGSATRLARARLGATTRAEQVVWLWAALTLGLIALTVPLNWQRYFMPLLPASRLFVALGCVALWQLARRRARSASPVCRT
ncbi:MAG: phospholipid carrier-dependent glycosyltransferase [Chloroflexota bacterium]